MNLRRPGHVLAPRLIAAAALLASVTGLAIGAARARPVRSAAAPPAADAALAPAAEPVPAFAEGRLGAFVAVADACSYYPLTTCGGAIIQVSESTPGQLSRFVGLDVRIELTTAVCGSSIAGRPLEGPVAVRVQTAGPCGPPLTPQACPKLANRVPAVVIDAALADPGRVLGWGDRCNGAVPFGPFNPRKSRLTLLNPGVPFHPTLNSVVFKCGCP
ncbi:MAG: hypothetical protein IT332_15470 [Ardenticatenales bacterium]|nr:hypothetical protein [Ardenticatenales bacterium]